MVSQAVAVMQWGLTNLHDITEFLLLGTATGRKIKMRLQSSVHVA